MLLIFVFRLSSGVLRKLKTSHVDTGMGLERISSVIAQSSSNYDTDLFQPLLEVIRKVLIDNLKAFFFALVYLIGLIL